MGYNQPEELVTIPVDQEFTVGRVEPDTPAYYVDGPGNRRTYLTALAPSRTFLYCEQHGTDRCIHKDAVEKFRRHAGRLLTAAKSA